MNKIGANFRLSLILTLVLLIPAVWYAQPASAGIVASEAVIQEIKVEGAKVLSPDKIMGFLEFGTGDLYSESLMAASQRKLEDTGLFRRVEIVPEEFTYGKVRVTVKVEEYPADWNPEKLTAIVAPFPQINYLGATGAYRLLDKGLAVQGTLGWDDGVFVAAEGAYTLPYTPVISGRARIALPSNSQGVYGEALAGMDLPLVPVLDTTFWLGLSGDAAAGTVWALFEPDFSWSSGGAGGIEGQPVESDRVDNVRLRIRAAVPFGKEQGGYLRSELNAEEKLGSAQDGELTLSFRGGVTSAGTPAGDQFVLGGFRGLYSLSDPSRGTNMILLTLSYSRPILWGIPLTLFAEAGDVWSGGPAGWSDLNKDIGAKLEFRLPGYGTELALTGAMSLDGQYQGRLQFEVSQPW